jgi:hypothetical protein
MKNCGLYNAQESLTEYAILFNIFLNITFDNYGSY